MSTELDLDDVAAQSPLAMRELADLRAALAQSDAQPEFCCEHAWSHAKEVAWKERDLLCDCDHNESCEKCWPLDFRRGGKWFEYTAAPAPAQPEPEPVAWMMTPNKLSHRLLKRSVQFDKPVVRADWELTPLFAVPPPPAPEQPTEDGSTEKTGTVPWPVVESYSGGADPAGIGGRVWLRMGDGPETVEYVPARPEQPALSDEQIDKILDRERMRWATSPPTYEFAHAFARAIERALKGTP